MAHRFGYPAAHSGLELMPALTLILPAPRTTLAHRSENDTFGLRKQLRQLVRKSNTTTYPVAGFDAHLFAAMGFDVAESAPPAAAVTRLFDGGVADERWWMRIDPVHLVPNRDFLVLCDAEAIPLEQHEADSLVKEILSVFVDDQWDLQPLNSRRWYLSVPNPPQLQTTALHDVIDKNIDHFLPVGEDLLSWRSLLTEVQMILHNSPVNRDRDAAGQPSINSVWFWGEGVLPAEQVACWDAVWSDDPLVGGLAKLSNSTALAVPADVSEILNQRDADRTLVTLPMSTIDTRSKATLSESYQRFIRDWIAPAQRAVKSGQLDEFTVQYVEQTEVLALTSKRRFQKGWWRF